MNQMSRAAMPLLCGLLLTVGCTSLFETKPALTWEPLQSPCALIQLGIPADLSSDELAALVQSPFQGSALNIKAGVLGECDSKIGREQLAQVLQRGLLLKLVPEPPATRKE